MPNQGSEIEEDGLIIPPVGRWSEEKYDLVRNYIAMFTGAMREKWNALVYIDLFSGAGYAKIERISRIVQASPIIALNAPKPFDKYIFCDNDAEKINALRMRVERNFAHLNCYFFEGDSNVEIDSISNEIPMYSKNFKVLAFCFIDPYNLRCLKFQTVECLSQRYVDFLILLPTYMDGNRNIQNYLRSEDNRVEQFTGLEDWRERWSEAVKNGTSFGSFLADNFGKQMASLDYIYNGIGKMRKIHQTSHRVPLYHLAFFSRNKLGEKFWEESVKYSNQQLSLF